MSAWIGMWSYRRQQQKARHRLVIAGQCAAAVDARADAVPPCNHKGGGENPKCPQCARRQAFRDAAAEVRKTGGLKP